MAETLTRAQRRTLPARQALAEKFATPEQKSAFYSGLAKRSSADRLVLSGDERLALLSAYEILSRIAERAKIGLRLTDAT